MTSTPGRASYPAPGWAFAHTDGRLRPTSLTVALRPSENKTRKRNFSRSCPGPEKGAFQVCGFRGEGGMVEEAGIEPAYGPRPALDVPYQPLLADFMHVHRWRIEISLPIQLAPP